MIDDVDDDNVRGGRSRKFVHDDDVMAGPMKKALAGACVCVYTVLQQLLALYLDRRRRGKRCIRSLFADKGLSFGWHMFEFVL